MKKRVLFAIFLFVTECLMCQRDLTVNLDTVSYAVLNSSDLDSIVIINISNISQDDLYIWITACPDSTLPDIKQKHKFFFRTCGDREYTLFEYLTDNWSLNTDNVYLGFSFIKMIVPGKTFHLVSSLKNVDFYLKRTVIMKKNKFEDSFIKIKEVWLYKPDVIVLDSIVPVTSDL